MASTSRIFEYFVVCGLGPEIRALDGLKGFHGAEEMYMPAFIDQFPHSGHALYPPPPPQLPTCTEVRIVRSICQLRTQPCIGRDRNLRMAGKIIGRHTAPWIVGLRGACYFNMFNHIPARDLFVPAHIIYNQNLLAVSKSCVLPAGVRIYSSGLDANDVSTYPRSYPIVLTEGDGSKIYVSCIAFRDPICEDIIEAYQIPISFQPLVQCLDVDKLIQLFTAVLLERRILLRSNKYTLLTLVSEAICHLIYPIRWQHVYIPIIFSSGVDYIDAPTPYMMGLHSGVDTSTVTMDGFCNPELKTDICKGSMIF
ncbi:unnamed protein product [Triticum turgidum subsp. durum]|uniref:UDENN domain-containing protein n=1 Tax=Triticum turgidum subsp. durum TaxID=4567 RepID=A0A9R0RIG0_TRITD|nr:unnamed protein product [Triticum turgidum subsp. durum]